MHYLARFSPSLGLLNMKIKKHNIRRFSCTTIGAACVLLASNVYGGGTYNWTNGDGGAFNEPTNWSDPFGNDGVPGLPDIASFLLDGTYTVSFTDNHTTDQLQILAGNVTFDLASASRGGSHQYTLANQFLTTPSILVGEGNAASASLDILNGSLSGVFTEVGLSGADGWLNVVGADASLNNQWHLRIGTHGTGSFNVLEGATAWNHHAHIAAGDGATGQVTVGGAGSVWTSYGTLSVGIGGHGVLFIEEQGEVISGSAIIAQLLGAEGEAFVAGPESFWTINGSLDVGLNGYGELHITDGASVSNGTFAVVGTHPIEQGDISIRGRATVDGHGSLWTIDHSLYVGTVASGEMTLSRGGRVEVGDDMVLGGIWNSASKLTIELDSNDNYQSLPAIFAGGSVQARLAEVTLIDGYVPTSGDGFRIVESGSSASMTFNLPPLGASLNWMIVSDNGLGLQVVDQADVGDLNNDGSIDISDLLMLLSAWGSCPNDGTCLGDLNGDGVVDVSDLLILLANWG